MDGQLQNLHIVENGKASKSLFVKASKHVISKISEIKNFHIQEGNSIKLMNTLLILIIFAFENVRPFYNVILIA